MSKVPLKKLLRDESLQKKFFKNFDPLKFQTINPVNNKLIKSFDYDSHDKTDHLVDKAWKSFQHLKTKSTLDEQIEKLKNLKEKFVEHKESLAQLITFEMGKTIVESRAEVERTSGVINYYMENSRRFLDNKPLPDYGSFKNYLVHEPLGPILHIAPWNFPLAVPLKSIIPCIAARNPCILKPAPNVPQTSLLLMQCFKEAGFTNSEFQISFADVNSIDKLIGDQRMRYVVFTGSTNAGRTIGELCGKHIKRCLLELGGSDPMLVLKDYDPLKAAEIIVSARVIANGQRCTSTKRVIIDEKIFKEVEKHVNEKMSKLILGDPSSEKTNVGPIARYDLFMKLNSQLIDYIEDRDYSVDDGCFIKPVVVSNPDKNSRPYKEELFGPAITLFSAKNEHDMIKIANDTVYGLSGSCLSNDEEKAMKIMSKVDCGMAFINTSYTTHPSIPFGGYKDSGFGRANSFYIFNEVTNIKTFTINKKH